MIGFSGKCKILNIDKNCKTKNGKDCVRVLLLDPNNKSDWYTGETITFYGEENRSQLLNKVNGDVIGVQSSTSFHNGKFDVFYSVYQLRG